MLYLRKLCLTKITRISSCVFFSRHDMVLVFIFISIIPIRLIFICDARYAQYRSKFTFFSCGSPVPASLVKRCSFLQLIVFESLLKINRLFLCGSILGISFLFHRSVHLPLPQYHPVAVTLAF